MGVLDDDLANIFYNTADEHTGAQQVTLRPQGSNGRLVVVIVEDGLDEEFEAGDIDFDQMVIRIRSADNTVGLMVPTIIGRGVPDDFTGFQDNALTRWYVAAVLEDGKKSGSKEHRLLIRNELVGV